MTDLVHQLTDSTETISRRLSPALTELITSLLDRVEAIFARRQTRRSRRLATRQRLQRSALSVSRDGYRVRGDFHHPIG